MSDKSKKFHEFALKSVLFKGRPDWYFCYLKTERIAHVLAVLAARAGSTPLKDIAHHAGSVPGEIARLAAGELSPAAVLAELFVLLADVRLAGTIGSLTPDNAGALTHEYEQVAERLMAGAHLSPFVGPDDFFVQDLSGGMSLPKADFSPYPPRPIVKDIKGQDKGHTEIVSDRTTTILTYIRKHRSSSGHGASIKEIAVIVPGCSEKTVQRELNSLIEQGLVRRVGERRWSLYEPL